MAACGISLPDPPGHQGSPQGFCTMCVLNIGNILKSLTVHFKMVKMVNPMYVIHIFSQYKNAN